MKRACELFTQYTFFVLFLLIFVLHHCVSAWLVLKPVILLPTLGILSYLYCYFYFVTRSFIIILYYLTFMVTSIWHTNSGNGNDDQHFYSVVTVGMWTTAKSDQRVS